jgi:hypothetical protein
VASAGATVDPVFPAGVTGTTATTLPLAVERTTIFVMARSVVT